MQKKHYFCSVKRKIGILSILFSLLLGVCSCQSTAWRGKKLQYTLHQQQHRANQLLTHVAEAIETNNFDSIWHYTQADKTILFYIYKGNQLVYWSNAWLSSSERTK